MDLMNESTASATKNRRMRTCAFMRKHAHTCMARMKQPPRAPNPTLPAIPCAFLCCVVSQEFLADLVIAGYAQHTDTQAHIERARASSLIHRASVQRYFHTHCAHERRRSAGTMQRRESGKRANSKRAEWSAPRGDTSCIGETRTSVARRNTNQCRKTKHESV
jgi:hypothetical protein